MKFIESGADMSELSPAGGAVSPPRLRSWGSVAGILGPVLLVVYFSTPAFVHWPFAGASPAALTDYANSHSLLFYVGGWLQVTGAVLSVLFFLVLLQLSGARAR